MKRALQHLLTTHFSQNSGIHPSKEVLDIITESSNGDIRSAIMALQFACVRPNPGFELPEKSKGKVKSKKGNVNARMIMEAVTRREQSLALFHLIGKILYNKRKGDPPSQSASAKDRERDRGLDAKLKDPTKLPTHLREHDRKTSRVDVEMLYADSPIDSSLLSLYIHQNYTQYCNELDECEGIMEWLSWVDSSGGDSWQQANPHRFHLLTLGTMHSLPTPVPRRNQKAYKPAFFDVLKRERESEDGIREVHEWLRMVGPFTPIYPRILSLGFQQDDLGTGWTWKDISTDLGAVLKAKDIAGSTDTRPPLSHRRFSRMEFTRDSSGLTELADEGDMGQDSVPVDDDDRYCAQGEKNEADRGGWLEGDDIEEF
ncbi:hypothetical protein EW026_g827 [Hermanssonia centrifuga]|uniref:Checkpoint protein RAD24-like helical bundle domain-containing protein n=1 Tax=Hermanssonia centrifuga TaxID=98765 RepID=A0A4S4KTX5_9APHY|nr:hypothetical protein EW026_g827 [Hermanssonia centrifuga]